MPRTSNLDPALALYGTDLLTINRPGVESLKATLPEVREYMNGGSIFNVEDYGAVPIADVTDPEATADSTAAIQSAINACFAAGGGHVYLPRPPYHLAAAPLHTGLPGGTIYCQLYLPLTTYQADHFPKINLIVGRCINNEAQGIIDLPQTLLGATFYSSYVSADTSNQPSVLGFQRSDALTDGTIYGDIFKDWNYTAVDLGEMSVVIKTVNSGGAAIVNTMCGIDLEYITQCEASRTKIGISGSIYNSLTPQGTNNFGLRCPKADNHAVNNFGTILVTGFERGVIISEHFKAFSLTMAGNYVAIEAKALGYPATIVHLTTEMNAYAFDMQNARVAIAGTWSGERSTAGKWYDGVHEAFVTSPSSCHLSVGQFAVHTAGGGHATFSSNAEFDVKIFSDEDGVNQTPLNIWTTGTRPTPVRTGVYGLNTSIPGLEYWNGSAWVAL